ncbi:TetR/AcrR family transcriptional regulator [Amycolatopsis anabasis]|uniref:TetR/AcrR family transcriptional regulator n=1 Tax=Amycolatopsis anabasis TaxID=1840409 RepID=UPI00131D435F|nr:TetR/AcrR family transcriptional regulator [Amycolatopsis anabasis]
MNKRVERGRATREQLIAIGTRLFAERGYEDTSIEAVIHESGVSRGAIYHHFAGKEGLFEAVLEDLGAKTDAELATVARAERDPVASLRAGCLAWLRLAGDPVVQRVMLIDAPSVLGWQRWRALDEKQILGRIKAALRAVASAGRIPAEFAVPFAHMLLASLTEAALLIARADDPETAARTSEAAVEEFLDRLLGGNLP